MFVPKLVTVIQTREIELTVLIHEKTNQNFLGKFLYDLCTLVHLNNFIWIKSRKLRNSVRIPPPVFGELYSWLQMGTERDTTPDQSSTYPSVYQWGLNPSQPGPYSETVLRLGDVGTGTEEGLSGRHTGSSVYVTREESYSLLMWRSDTDPSTFVLSQRLNTLYRVP